MRKRFLVSGLVIFFLFASAGTGSSQTDVSGEWDVSFEGRTVKVVLALAQTDSSISGTWTVKGHEAQTISGSVSGDSLYFSGQHTEADGSMIISTHVGVREGDTLLGRLSFTTAAGKPIGRARKWQASRINSK